MSLESKASVGTVDSINTSGVRLVDIDSHAFKDGDSIYCKSNDCIYVMQLGKSYIVDNDRYVTALNLTTGQWVKAINTDIAPGAGGITALTGNVTASGTGSVVATIPPGQVTLAMQANLGANTIIGNATGVSAVPTAMSVATAQALLAIPVATSPAAVALSRATTLCGPTMSFVAGDDFQNDRWYDATAVGTLGTYPLLATEKGGVIKLSTGATSAHGVIISPHASGGSGSIVPAYVKNGQTQPWYACMRGQFNTAGTAQTYMYMGLINPASINTYQNIRWGINGAATDLAYQSVDNTNASLAAATTSQAYDNGWHTFEMWNDLTNLSFAYDGVVIATTPHTNIYAGAFTLYAAVYNGTDNVTRDLWIDYLYFVGANN